MNDARQRFPLGPVLAGCGIVLYIWMAGCLTVAYLLWRYHPFSHHVGHSLHASANSAPAPLPKLKPLPQADALAQRMSYNQDIYRNVRDAALAGYLKLHPKPAAYDEEAHDALRLLAYLCVWGDYYGEGLWQQYGTHASHLTEVGANFSIWYTLKDAHNFEDHYSSDERSALLSNAEAFDFGTTFYPALFKLKVYQAEIENLLEGRRASVLSPGLKGSLADLPRLVDCATQSYAELVRAHFSHEFLYRKGADLLHAGEMDESTLTAISTGITKAFAVEDKDDPVDTTLQGEFYVNDAWCARGSGYANTVNDEGWRLFHDRLEKANTILTDLYVKHPEEPGISKTMMTVVLGQGLSRDQMELWFHRGLKVTTDVYPYYMSKRYYLLPRWYGSSDTVWKFGQECAESNDWAGKVPLILFEAIDDSGSDDPGVYESSDVWTPLEKVFRGYLEHYPDSSIYRSHFLKCAVAGGHWDVAAQQIEILGDDWDRTVFPRDEYAQATRLVRAHK